MGEPIDPYGGRPVSSPYGPDLGYPPPPSPYAYPPPDGYAPPPGYPAPYPPGPPPRYPLRVGRPGGTTAAAVLAFVLAGLLSIAAILLLAGSAVTNDIGNELNTDTSWTAEFVVDALINLVTAAALIAGGVAVLSRRRTGLYLMTVGNLVVVAAAVYWIIRFDVDGGLVGFAIIYSGLAVVSAALAWTPEGLRWLSAAPPFGSRGVRF